MRRGIVGFSLLVGLSGCILSDRYPHNDVLVFGTSTKIALDVSAPLQNGALPEFTLGYKRSEGVWMPLRPNGAPEANGSAESRNLAKRLQTCTNELTAKAIPVDAANAVCVAQILPADKYVSYASGIDPAKGGKDVEIDTYSVFASFGGRGELSINSSSGNIAQFFATGIAAQRLGANPSLAAALNAKGTDAVVKVAEAEVEKAKTARVALLADATLKAEAAQIAKVDTAWTVCPVPTADDAAYARVLEQAKADQPSPWWVLLEGIQRKVTILERLQQDGDLILQQAYETARLKVCSPT